MSFQHRIRTIYVKELVDILRDRRTLIAMIVVPILLYPLLMVGSIQAVSMQSAGLRDEKVIVLSPNERQSTLIQQWIAADKGIVSRLGQLDEQERAALFGRGVTPTETEDDVRSGRPPSRPSLPDDARRPAETPAATDVGGSGRPPSRPTTDDDLQPESLDRFDFKFDRESKTLEKSQEYMQDLVQARHVQLGLIIGTRHAGDPLEEQNLVRMIYDPEEIRSATAADRIRAVLERRAVAIRLKRLEQIGVAPVVITPIVPELVHVTTPGSVLGQILPLILVLMTITGAIYPAIDLTAGERERGTLETLMVCPVPVLDLVVGKFLVVTTVAILGAALNLASVSATVYFGGFESVVNAAGDEGFPLGALPLILLILVPFAVFMSAIMIAVCSYARTFKEAQNYVTPVIFAVLIPGGIAALPATRLEGVMLVMPVANMVLLTRELLLGAAIDPTAVLSVLLSTTLYAAAAVAVATKVFGTEAVIFADTVSLRGTFSRRLIRPTERPSLATASLVVALLFPIWFYVQSSLQSGHDFGGALRQTGWLMPLFFVALPLAVCAYFRIDVRRTFALAAPGGRHLLAAVLIGLSVWVLGHELVVAQQAVLPVPEALHASDEMLQQAIDPMPRWMPLLLLAVVPAVCEEFLFRGFLLGGLSGAVRKWAAILAGAAIFGAFHYYVFRFPVTALLGVVLGFLCWQSRSIWPGVLMHTLHNGLQVSLALWPDLPRLLGLEGEASSVHFPLRLILPATGAFLLGLILAARPRAGSPR